jgi:hypothetical protein
VDKVLEFLSNLDLSGFIPTARDLLWLLAVLVMGLVAEVVERKGWGRPPNPGGAGPDGGGDPSRTPPLDEGSTHLGEEVNN